MAANPKTLLTRFQRTGPHRVALGDLAQIGTPGLLYAPALGSDLPALAFGHGWLTHPKRYHRTLRHLASWGFAVAAPTTERGFFASDKALAADLSRALEVLSTARLGKGGSRVNAKKLGLVGHGFGASAAVLAAADVQTRGVAALWPAHTTAAVVKAAGDQTAPGLILTTVEEELSLTSNATELALAWEADVVLRAVPGFASDQLPERFGPRGWLELDLAPARPRVHAQLVGWLLGAIAQDKDCAVFTDPGAELPGVAPLDATVIERNTVSAVRALLD